MLTRSHETPTNTPVLLLLFPVKIIYWQFLRPLTDSVHVPGPYTAFSQGFFLIIKKKKNQIVLIIFFPFLPSSLLWLLAEDLHMVQHPSSSATTTAHPPCPLLLGLQPHPSSGLSVPTGGPWEIRPPEAASQPRMFWKRGSEGRGAALGSRRQLSRRCLGADIVFGSTASEQMHAHQSPHACLPCLGSRI